MASVVKKREVIERVILELSLEEARTLLAVCNKIGGSRTKSRRKHTESIADELKRVGISTPHPILEKWQAKEEGFIPEEDIIRFENWEELED